MTSAAYRGEHELSSITEVVIAVTFSRSGHITAYSIIPTSVVVSFTKTFNICNM